MHVAMSTCNLTHSASGAAPDRQMRLYACTWSILGRLKAPRMKAAGQMDLLTVPSVDSVDSKVIQVDVEEALSASSRDR